MNKNLTILIIFLLLMNLTSATKLGISPANLVFRGYPNERICKNLSITTDYNGILKGESRWSGEPPKEKTIINYNLGPEDIGVIVEFPKEINTTNSTAVEICITAKKIEHYYGAITYITKDNNVGVGSWIELEIDSFKEEAYEKSPKTKKGFLFIFLFLVSTVLFLMFVLLIFIKEKSPKNKKLLHNNL